MRIKGRGLLLIVAGPSGGGKSTIVREILADKLFPISFSVSATSRAPRPGEIDGIHYRFLSRADFEQWIDRGEFLEHAEVHGNLYGTPKGPVVSAMEQGNWIILDIDVQGHRQIKQAMPEAVSIFLRAPSLEVYADRMRQRGTETEESLACRLRNAEQELLFAKDFDYQLINEDVSQAVRTFRSLLLGICLERNLADVG